MKRLTWSVSVWLLAMAAVAAQQKKSTPVRATPATAAGPTAAKICDDPYQVREPAEGWPEAPVYILFHREKSKAPWSRNPAIRIAGLEAASPAGARTLVCVEEALIKRGRYETDETGYILAEYNTITRQCDLPV